MDDCVFCKIVRGEFGTEYVYENETAVVFRDINPKADTHLLVVPKKHFASLKEIDNELLLGKLMITVKAAAEKAGLNSYKTVINTGKEAGQEVFHLHIHILAGDIRL